ncbi:MAG: O-antigen ligase family protein [Elusimicrobia bacterium]|nr:O-antigen ligase family protein [Elusimicrobiota bacterium]
MGAVPRLFAFCILLGGLREPLWFAAAAAAVWAAVWTSRPALGPAINWLPWLGWAGVSALVSSQPLAALPPLARWSTALACASLAASWKPKEREDWLRAFLIAAAGAAVAALATGAGRGWANNMTGVLPPYSNYTAFVLTGAAAAAAAWLLHPRGPKGRERAAAIALLALCVASLFLLRSRGAWLGIGAAAFVWTVRHRRPRESLALALFAVFMGAALTTQLMPASWENALLKKYRAHAEARPRIWRAAAAIASDSPWLGVGPGNFGAGFRRRPVPFEDGAARWSMSTDYSHGEAQQAAAETGWAGLALWLLGAGVALGAMLRKAGDDPVREAAALAAAALSAHLLVDNMLQIPALAALWLTALALAAPPPGAIERWPRVAIVAAGLLALVSWIPKTLAASSPARAAVLFPDDPGPREDLAYAAARAHDASSAFKNFGEAARLAPYNAIYRWRLAQFSGAIDRWNDAEFFIARAIELEPGFMRARLLRVEALVHLGKKKEARAELDEFRRLRDTRVNPGIHSGYDATVWEFGSDEYERAVSVASGRK